MLHAFIESLPTMRISAAFGMPAGWLMSYCHGGDSKQARIRQKKVGPFPLGIWAFGAFLVTSIRSGFSLLRSPWGAIRGSRRHVSRGLRGRKNGEIDLYLHTRQPAKFCRALESPP